MTDKRLPKSSEKHRRALRRYNHSDLGKATRKAWTLTDKGKESIARANAKYVETGKRADWLASPKGKSYTEHVNSEEEEKRRRKVNAGVASFIIENREKQGLTVSQFAEKIMVIPELVRHWENGRAIPTYEKWILISEVFGVKYRRDILPLLEEARRKSEKSLL